MNMDVAQRNIDFINIILSGDVSPLSEQLTKLANEGLLNIELYANSLVIMAAFLQDHSEEPTELLKQWWGYVKQQEFDD